MNRCSVKMALGLIFMPKCYRDFGKELFMDAETQKAHTAWGSFADAGFIQSGALSHMRGKFAYIWAGAVLHVLTKDEVRAFLTHAHAMLAPNGTFFGVSLHVLTADLQASPAP